jgi:HPt (histidine-containing phosphotransfer) domain-containing protein
LRNDLGSDGFEEVVELFLEEMDNKFHSIKNSSNTQLFEDIHFLKGCAANLGFAELFETCSKAEQVSNPDIETIRNSYDQSKIEFLASQKVDLSQIKTPERTSSSVMSR